MSLIPVYQADLFWLDMLMDRIKIEFSWWFIVFPLTGGGSLFFSRIVKHAVGFAIENKNINFCFL